MQGAFRAKIDKYLSVGESVQVIAPPGFGKSRFGRALGGLYLDTNLLQTPLDLQNEVKNSPQRQLIVIDSLDHIMRDEYQPFFAFLKATRDQHKNQLAFVFLTRRLIGPQFSPILGNLYSLASEHIEYLPTLSPADYPEFKIADFAPKPSQWPNIIALSGGIPALVKICLFALRDGTSLDFTKNPKLTAQIDDMLSVSPDCPAYAKSRLIQVYLKHSPSQLTAAETRLLNLLLKQQNRIVSKDEICRIIYPDVKNTAGISDHALDQLIHRLRAKTKDKYTITTHRGLGYQLSA